MANTFIKKFTSSFGITLSKAHTPIQSLLCPSPVSSPRWSQSISSLPFTEAATQLLSIMDEVVEESDLWNGLRL